MPDPSPVHRHTNEVLADWLDADGRFDNQSFTSVETSTLLRSGWRARLFLNPESHGDCGLAELNITAKIPHLVFQSHSVLCSVRRARRRPRDGPTFTIKRDSTRQARFHAEAGESIREADVERWLDLYRVVLQQHAIPVLILGHRELVREIRACFGFNRVYVQCFLEKPQVVKYLDTAAFTLPS